MRCSISPIRASWQLIEKQRSIVGHLSSSPSRKPVRDRERKARRHDKKPVPNALRAWRDLSSKRRSGRRATAFGPYPGTPSATWALASEEGL